MKDTNKLVLGVTIVFTIVSVIAVLFGGSAIVSGLCSLVAVALSLAYKYKSERDNALEFHEVLINVKNSQIQKLMDVLESNSESEQSIKVTELDVVKKPRRSKSKSKTEIVA